jgi:hypothetical protein
MIIFSLIETSFLRNNELFKRKSTKSKGNRIVKMGKLFLTNSLRNVCFKNDGKSRFFFKLKTFLPQKLHNS